MIKPILYHDIREKNKIEAELVLETSQEERSTVSLALIDLFANVRLSSISDSTLITAQQAKKNE